MGSWPRWVLLQTDCNNSVGEAAETNNVLAVPVDLPGPDLVPLGLNVIGVSGRTLTVVHTVTNQGTGLAGGSWYDYIYVSSNAVWDAGDYDVLEAYQAPNVPSGGSYRATNTLTLPSWANDSHYLIVKANDYNQRLFELTQTNNTLVVPLAGQALPDLVPVGLSVIGVSGRTLTVVHTVTNQGPVAAGGYWYDYIYVSSNAVWDAGDYDVSSRRIRRPMCPAGGATGRPTP